MITKLNHIGLSVANLDRSVKFYKDVFDMTLMGREHFQGDLYDKLLMLDNVSGEVALLRNAQLQLELFQFANRDPALPQESRPVNKLGITHFCVEVDDINQAYEKWKAAGVTWHCEPIRFSESTHATYARDPDGNVFEVMNLRGEQAS
jgi:catechol 2,3-dioxygenase-like lactoylglutathione lyase family enzyme